jgi:hypothetical protein
MCIIAINSLQVSETKRYATKLNIVFLANAIVTYTVAGVMVTNCWVQISYRRQPLTPPSHIVTLHIHFSLKGKAIPIQAWTGPEGSRRLTFPDFKTIDP